MPISYDIYFIADLLFQACYLHLSYLELFKKKDKKKILAKSKGYAASYNRMYCQC